MKEITFYGRGGQGAVIASRVLAIAASKEGKYVQSFPFFGVERRGAPVTAYTRINGSKIRKRAPIERPDYVVVLDPTLLKNVDVAHGLKEKGHILLNTKSSGDSFRMGKDHGLLTFDAAKIAIRHGLGSKSAPIVNTVILGAFSRLTGVIGIESLREAIRENIAIKTGENIKAAGEAYEEAGKK